MSRLVVMPLLLVALSVTTMGWTTAAPTPSADVAEPPDGKIQRGELRHVAEVDLYRSPTGVVEAGTPVRLRLRAADGDLIRAQAFFRDRASGDSWLVEMESVAAVGQANGAYDYWQTEIETRPFPMILDYGFVARNGAETCWLFGEAPLDSGGAKSDEPPQQTGWRLTFDHPDIKLPTRADIRDLEGVYRDRHASEDASRCFLSELEDPAGAGVAGGSWKRSFWSWQPKCALDTVQPVAGPPQA